MPPNPAAVPSSVAAPVATDLSVLSRNAARLGYGVVDVAGVLDQIDNDAQAQLTTAQKVGERAASLVDANAGVQRAAQEAEQASQVGRDILGTSLSQLRTAKDRSQAVALWVADIKTSMAEVMNTLRDVEVTNSSIAGISRQVNILAVNAKIEAARAGDAGRGFAVVAEAINELSRQTANSAASISQAIGALTASIETIHKGSVDMSGAATEVLADGAKTDQALTEIGAQVDQTTQSVKVISSEALQMGSALSEFGPAFNAISAASQNTAAEIDAVRQRMNAMIDLSEAQVQQSVEAGGVAEDALFIDDVQHRAKRIGVRFEQAVDQGQITEAALFSQTYQPISGTNPAQFMTTFTLFTDQVLPEVQEPALSLDRRVVFCAAVDRNGYLPTHNKIFSSPQSDDPVWNAAHCRNRRLFNDRVGLKAGRNIRPFLLQVYRRDMGGGEFVMMKDVSAPIFVHGRLWGGLRLAFRPDEARQQK